VVPWRRRNFVGSPVVGAWDLLGIQETPSGWWRWRRVGIRVLELDPQLGKATCGGAGERPAWYPLRSADLERLVSPGTVVF
jgi:hypothetical protein